MKTKWKTAPISRVCEVGRIGNLCGKPTAFCYPAEGGGWMALCEAHAEKHHPNTQWLPDLIVSGETLAEPVKQPHGKESV